MLSRLFAFFSSRRTGARAEIEQRDFQTLNELAPVKDACAAEPAPPVVQPGNRTDRDEERSVICREAVLNREQRVAGYEFMLRKGMRDRMRIPSRRIHHIYNEVVVRNLVHFSIGKLLGHRQVFVAVLDSFLANPIIEQLPGQNVVLTVVPLDAAEAPGPFEERVKELKKLGFKFALEECFEGAHFENLAPHANYFIFRTAQHNPADTKKAADQIRARHRDALLIARDLESFDDFELCRKLDFALFQGPFVTSREDWTGNRAGPQTLHVCDLLNHLRRDAETAELAKLLKQDAVLSYRLLRYINSAASGLRQTITSIEHALVLMGRQKMYRWLTLLLFGSAQNSPYAAALQENALARGRFMELIGERAFDKTERDSLFVTGLFSMIDLVLQMPLPEAIKPLHLQEAVEAALLRDEGPYAPFLALAVACESSDQDRIEAAAAKCGVEIDDVNIKHFEALAWVQSIEY